MLGLVAMGCAVSKSKQLSDHYNGEAFFNPTNPESKGSFFSAMKMWVGTTRAQWPEAVENTAVPQFKAEIGDQEVGVTFVNHATFLLQFRGLTILTDPVWSERVSPISWLGPGRVRKPGVALEQLPHVDLIIISHNHYDHLDTETLKRLNQKFAPQVFVPMGDGPLIQALGFKECQEFDWWESTKVRENVKVTFLPTQHFSARGLFDRNQSLWGSYLVQAGDFRVYFGGDAGYSSHYQEIYKRMGAPDIAILGIGAYEPEWFMRPMHMNPAEAVLAHQDLHAKVSIGMHFGTFQLSAEGIDQPLCDLKWAREKAGLSEAEFTTLLEGQTRMFTWQKRQDLP